MPKPNEVVIEDELVDMIEDKKHITGAYTKIGEIDDEKRTVTAIITSDAIDRDQEVLSPKGADLEQFQKNGVVLWSHNSSLPPIGKAVHIKRGRKKIIATVKFATTELAEDVWQLFKGGFLKAFSVGFMPTKSHVPTPDEIKKNPMLAEARRIFDEWTLLEFSAVSVPANPEALALAVKNKSVTLSDNMLDELKIEPEVVIEKIEDDSAEEGMERMGFTKTKEPAKIVTRIPVKEVKIKTHTPELDIDKAMDEFMARKKGLMCVPD